MAELKPCPFCGGDAQLEHIHDGFGYSYVRLEILDHAMKAREMAFDIYKKLFGTMPSDPDNPKIECAFDALNDINRIEKDTLEVLNAVIGRIGD